MTTTSWALMPALVLALYAAHRHGIWRKSSIGTRVAFCAYFAVVIAAGVAGEVITRHLTDPNDLTTTYSTLCTLVIVSVQGFLLASLSREKSGTRGLGWIVSLVMIAGLGAWVAWSLPATTPTSKAMVFAGFVFGGLITVLADAANSAPADQQR